jgi:hypothetical protein
MEKIDEISERLQAAKQRVARARKALAPKHKGGEVEEFRSAQSELLGIERELAAAKGEEYAITIDFPVQWNTGAPCPHVVASEQKVFLIFLLNVPDPNWDGTYVTSVDPAALKTEALGLVEFELCTAFKMGSPNDEVFSGHPLHGKGLEGYRAQEVINSKWLKELEAINRVHPQYNPNSWKDLHHYVFWFHDTTFECVTYWSYKVEVFNESFPEIVARASKRLWER